MLSFLFYSPEFWVMLASPTPRLERSSSMSPFSTCFIALRVSPRRLLLNVCVWDGVWIPTYLLPNGHPVVPLALIEDSVFAPWLEIPPSAWIKFPYEFGPFPSLSSMFLWSDCLFLHQYDILHYVDFTVCVIISDRMFCLWLFVFQGFLYCTCMKLRVNYLAPRKKKLFLLILIWV